MIRRLAGTNILAVLITALLLSGCAPGGDETASPDAARPPETPETVEPAPEPSADASAEEPESAGDVVTQGLVTFLVGDAFLHEGSEEWTSLDIGDPILRESIVRVGPDSYLDIQLGTYATVRLESQTIVSFQELALQTGARRATLEVSTGSILNRVERLTGRDSYRVLTQTTIAGVRGTDFGVIVGEDGQTRVGVTTGSVTVVPRWTEALEDFASQVDDPDVAGVVQDLAREYADQYTVQPGRQAVLPATASVETPVAVETFIQQIRDSLTGQEASRGLTPQEIRDLGTQTLREQDAVVRTGPQTPSVQAMMDRINGMRTLDLPSGAISDQALLRVVVTPAGGHSIRAGNPRRTLYLRRRLSGRNHASRGGLRRRLRAVLPGDLL